MLGCQYAMCFNGMTWCVSSPSAHKSQDHSFVAAVQLGHPNRTKVHMLIRVNMIARVFDCRYATWCHGVT
jgi:hypothetical protein